MQFDWVKLNWIDYPSQTKRQPCSSVVFGGTTYPGVLIGLTDTNGATFCVGSALRTGKPYSAAQSISEVLQLDNPANPGEMHRDPLGGSIGSPPFTVSPGWFEWYAQAMAIRARTDLALGISSSNRPVYDELVLDGYFECTAGPTGWVQLNYLNPSSGSKLNTAAGCVGKVLPDGWFFIH